MVKQTQAMVDRILTGPEAVQLKTKVEELKKLGMVTKANVGKVFSFLYREFSDKFPEEFEKPNIILRVGKNFPSFMAVVDAAIQVMTDEAPKPEDLFVITNLFYLRSKEVIKETQEKVDDEVARLQTKMA